MQEKSVYAGIFWAVPDKIFGQGLVEFRKSYYMGCADANGFINYPYSHFEMWEEVGGLGNDCYKYPRGRVLYDTKSGKHRIFADECVAPSIIDEVVELFEIEDYELWYDEHYVCRSCADRDKKENATLEYNVLRGKEKIGENLIEISCGSTKILVELGRALSGGDELFERDVLQKTYSAVVISHYHEDHAGLIKYKRDCPIYIGSGAARVLQATYAYRGEQFPQNVKTYRSGRAFKVGGIKVTPYRCDHSAFDSYMLLFEAGGRSILYTGDFRFHGRQNKEILLSALPKSVDVLIHEGTNIGKNACVLTEAEIENRAVEIMQATEKPVFVLQSSTNIDRLVSIYRASKRSGRITYMSDYQSLIASAAGGRIPRPDIFKDVIAFTPRGVSGERKEAFFQIRNKRGTRGISGGTKQFTMLVRPSMTGYIKKLFAAADFEGATLIYSIWKGYKQEEYIGQFLTEMQSLGMNIIDLHTSGHAAIEDIELLKQSVCAKQTVCVHTEQKPISLE